MPRIEPIRKREPQACCAHVLGAGPARLLSRAGCQSPRVGRQSSTRSPVAKVAYHTAPTTLMATATFHTHAHHKLLSIQPVTAVPMTPASTPAVLDRPRSTPA